MKARSDELQIFVCVIECGSISAAAEQVGQTPSAVSRTLSRLEAKLDTTLINRTTRRMDLTEEGKYFFEQAKLILDQMDELEERLSSRQQTPSGRLRINAASPFMLHAIVPYIAEFRSLYPDIQLELNSNDLIIDLLEQSTDIAIRIGTLADSTLHARSLGCSPLHILASPDYLKRHGTPASVAELSDHTLLGFTQTETLNDWPLRHVHGDRWPIQPGISASSGETVRHLALAGQGIACLSHFMTIDDIRAGRLTPLLAQFNSGYRQPINAVYYRNSQLALRIQCFLDFIQGKLAEYANPQFEG
ncbi:LysR family transcriptional regulator [Pseudomonas chlororaphis]|uniref:LysR family transcriptional regulator n=1 Tax=Pseudomonas chlororaphis TaxID=587753 RepID=UPI0006A62DFF|nr:LysR family transcriptional regulator [Pseudomonas chlororaphis]AZC99997.1 LysR family transcriptional regulator [Pseudomonas chlororaphis subsp. chlororaphis]MBM0282019.1 LysR family transcriptional regulator [Pseudomonas chlororaphis]MDO1504412.1 LysR family transcriptional regulator [Pseudomonas chlororaphis]ORM49455.1 LysR family transcriptional regulator [Pseudomonas chlororaphis subsp. chlororaphis]TWR94444.1 LysR family transcriptional regulator [Pseudomonas chlororaphis subsp. chlor